MKPIVFASTSAPSRMDVAGIPCVMSMICASGAMRFMTPWHVPTKSSLSPKSLRNVMNTPRSVTPLGRRGASVRFAVVATERSAASGAVAPLRRASCPVGRIRTNAVGSWTGRGRASTVAA